jgi:hypothetical protein
MNSEQTETLALNKPSLNRLYTYTGPTKYTFKYKDANFGKKDTPNSVDYFVVNFHQFLDPIVNTLSGHLTITASDGENKEISYFDS